MTDLANLGIRVESQEADVADKRLDNLAASADRAEKSVDALAVAARRADGATSTMNVAVQEQNRVLGVARNSLGLTTQEGLNLGRQMSDVGVQLAMGMSPFMIAVQQGPQILDVFQMAAIRTGTTVRAAMAATGAAIWAALAPLMPFILAVGAAVGVMAAGWGLATRSMNQDIGDLTNGMGLNEEQLERLKEKNISTTATAGDAWRGLGTTIKEMFAGVFGDELAWVDKQWNSFLDDLTKNTGAEVDAIAGFFVGAYNVVRDTWRLLPAAIGDAAISSANAAITAVNWLVAKSVEGVNNLRAQYNSLPAWMRGGQAAPMMGTPQFGALGNPYAGGMSAAFGVGAASYGAGYESQQGMSGRFMDRWRQNTLASARNRIGEGAGDAGSDAAVRRAREAREVLEQLPNINLQPLNIQLIELRNPLRDIADEARLVHSLALDAAQGLASAFGESGRALGDLLTTMSGYQSRMAEITLAEQQKQITIAQAERDRAHAQVQHYGDMLGAAKGFFDQNSEGYRVLQAAEAAWRVFQFAMSVQAMAQNAAETGTSVAGSMAKGAASTAAGAAKMFEVLGPFAFPAIAAMLALLTSVGLRGGGGGGSGRNFAANDNTAEATASISRSSQREQQAREGLSAAIASSVEVRVTADRDGLDAYVVGRAEDVARPLVIQGMAATAGATRQQVMSDLDKGRTYGRVA
jgi:hypothetical protein